MNLSSNINIIIIILKEFQQRTFHAIVNYQFSAFLAIKSTIIKWCTWTICSSFVFGIERQNTSFNRSKLILCAALMCLIVRIPIAFHIRNWKTPLNDAMKWMIRLKIYSFVSKRVNCTAIDGALVSFTQQKTYVNRIFNGIENRINCVIESLFICCISLIFDIKIEWIHNPHQRWKFQVRICHSILYPLTISNFLLLPKPITFVYDIQGLNKKYLKLW